MKYMRDLEEVEKAYDKLKKDENIPEPKLPPVPPEDGIDPASILNKEGHGIDPYSVIKKKGHDCIRPPQYLERYRPDKNDML